MASAVVEETLRWDPPVQVTMRIAHEDMELAAVGHRRTREHPDPQGTDPQGTDPRGTAISMEIGPSISIEITEVIHKEPDLSTDFRRGVSDQESHASTST
ncbi:hypothetical protein [Saccharopolyspora spinosa]|uniref:hypothetical protein n=1 Tax=Saccharopolyspora spinosa TaxID=60894 RepID=UPI003BA8B22A